MVKNFRTPNEIFRCIYYAQKRNGLPPCLLPATTSIRFHWNRTYANEHWTLNMCLYLKLSVVCIASSSSLCLSFLIILPIYSLTRIRQWNGSTSNSWYIKLSITYLPNTARISLHAFSVSVRRLSFFIYYFSICKRSYICDDLLTTCWTTQLSIPILDFMSSKLDRKKRKLSMNWFDNNDLWCSLSLRYVDWILDACWLMKRCLKQTFLD